MESLPERLRDLSKKKYFPFVAVVVFAFITALVFALIAFQTNDQTVDQLRRQAQDANRTPSRTSLENDTRSPIQRIIDAISGRKPVNPSDTTTDTINQDQNTSTTRRQSSRNVQIVTNGDQILKKIENESTPLPKVSVGKYVLNTTLPAKPAQVNIHKLKTNYSDTEVKAIAANFGLSPFTAPNTVLDKSKGAYQMYDLDKDLFLAFNTSDGSFVFIADNGVPAPTISTDPRDAAESFIQSTGMMQPCLAVTDAYESEDEPGITIVEMRCRWEYLGAPLMNTVGILNLEDETPLSSVKLGDTGFSTTFAAENIDGGDQRGASDFNTMIIKVDTQGNIRHVGSNVLPIETTSVVNEGSIISPDDALAALSAGQTRLTLTSPTGAGYIELPKVYPNGFANAQEASINDFILTYSVIPGIDQSYLCPKWVSRSTGLMSSGYNGLFVSTLQAVNDSRCTAPDLDPSAGAAQPLQATQTGAQQTLTTFNLNATPTGPAPTVTTGKAGSLKLDDIVFDFTEVPALGCPEAETFTNSRVLDASKGIYMMWKASQQRTWYIVFTKTDATQGVVDTSSGNLTDSARSEYLQSRAQYISACKPRTSTTICPLDTDSKQAIVSCVLLTTGSPSVYIYTNIARNMLLSVQPFGGVGFADPAPSSVAGSSSTDILTTGSGTNGLISWELFSDSTGTLRFANGTTRNRAYYEFRKNALLPELKAAGEPTTGYILKKNELASFIQNTLAPRIGLTSVETTDLIAEMTRETSDLQSSHVKLSLLPDSFVHSHLKLNLTPQPENVFRYIFYVTSASGSEQIKAPNLKPINPSNYYIVETGVLIGN